MENIDLINGETIREMRHAVKGIIFDYGGTLDSRGVHWSEIIRQGYEWFYSHGGENARVSKEQFREAYVHAERTLARQRIILPNDNFLDLLTKKMQIQIDYMLEQQWVSPGIVSADNARETVSRYCYDSARACIEEARPVLESLSAHYPMMLVSNFYGNVDSVLRDFDVRRYFAGIIESAVVGIRKPNPTLFRLGVDALELEPQQVLVVGDSLTKDMKPAESLGCHVLWLKGKGWTADEDAHTHPCTIKHISQVSAILGV